MISEVKPKKKIQRESFFNATSFTKNLKSHMNSPETEPEALWWKAMSDVWLDQWNYH